MDKIASPQELQNELRRLLAYSQSDKPSRERIAAELSELADRITASDRVAAAPYKTLAAKANDLKQACEEIRSAADKANMGDRAAVANVDNMARKARMYEAKCNMMIKALKAAEGAD